MPVDPRSTSGAHVQDVRAPLSVSPPVRRLSTLRGVLLPVGALGLLVVACNMTSRRVVLEYKLNAEYVEPDTESGSPRVPEGVQSHILGALGMLFGSPSQPKYMLTEDWIDDGYDPNWPQYPEDDFGSGVITDADFDEIVAGNQKRFANQLALVAEGNYAEVEIPKSAWDLQESWNDYVLEPIAEEDFEDSDEFREDALAMFENYYPSLRESSEMYRQQCLHCHGVEGGGDGTTAPYLAPLPRDYRKGIFKFTPLKDKARPRHIDLVHILQQGAYGTAMPSFKRFSAAELHGLADYVQLLSMRGEVEHYLVVLFEEEELLGLPQVLEAYEEIWSRWLDSDDKVITYDGEVPAVTQEMLDRGREIFMDAGTGNCFSCHGELGLGDGPAVWVMNEETGENEPAYQDDWGETIFPRNLTRPVFRGGRRPIDIYRRIYAGINGTPMPGLGEITESDDAPITKDDLWALVHYVRSLGETVELERRIAGLDGDDDHGHDHAEGDADGGSHDEDDDSGH